MSFEDVGRIPSLLTRIGLSYPEAFKDLNMASII